MRSLWRQLQNQRSKTQCLRSKLFEKRLEQQEKRAKRDQEDDAFMDLVRADVAVFHRTPPVSETLAIQFEKMQKSRTSCQLLEQEIMDLEGLHNDAELERDVLEINFYDHFYRTSGRERQLDQPPPYYDSDDKDDDDDGSPPSRASLLGILAGRSDETHPLYNKLLDLAGNRESANEHLEELRSERDFLVDRILRTLRLARWRATGGSPDKHQIPATNDDGAFQSFQVPAKIPQNLDEVIPSYLADLDKEALDFFRKYPEMEARALEESAQTKEVFDRTRKLAIDSGAMRKHPSFNEECLIDGAPSESFAFDPIILEDQDAGSQPPPQAVFPIILFNPHHVLGPEPLTTKGALREAVGLSPDDPSRKQRVAEAMKEHGILTLLSEYGGGNKSEFVNRWLLQRLRTSPLEVELLLRVFTETLAVRNFRRWQEDVLYWWPRDGANRSDELLHGPVTSEGTFFGANTTISGNRLNSRIESPKQQSSEPENPCHSPPSPFSPWYHHNTSRSVC